MTDVEAVDEVQVETEDFNGEQIEVKWRKANPITESHGLYPPLQPEARTVDGIRIERDVAVQLRDGGRFIRTSTDQTGLARSRQSSPGARMGRMRATRVLGRPGFRSAPSPRARGSRVRTRTTGAATGTRS
jgi:hypothetical protein